MTPKNISDIHEKALAVSKRYKKTEAELLEIIIQVRESKVYRYYECGSLFDYCVKILLLDPGVVYNFTAVATKANEVPELKEKIKDGSLNVSKARRLTSVLTRENKNEWIEKAQNMTVRKLEREVAKENPREEVRERTSYLRSTRVKLEVGFSEAVMLQLRRVQDLESQRARKSVTLEEVIGELVKTYLHKNDPIKKAGRAAIRGKMETVNTSKPLNESVSDLVPVSSDVQLKSATWQRLPLTAAVTHKVFLRDQGQCQFEYPTSRAICKNRRFIEIHHKHAVQQSGTNDLENLITLCGEHHKIAHMNFQR